MTDQFSDPGTGSGDQLPLNELLGSLLLITVHKETDEIETKFGATTAIETDVAVLDGTNKGTIYEGALIFPRILKSQLVKKVGAKVLGRLEQGENKKGNPPWQLATATDTDKETGRRYLAYIATQVTVPETPPEEPF